VVSVDDGAGGGGSVTGATEPAVPAATVWLPADPATAAVPRRARVQAAAASVGIRGTARYSSLFSSPGLSARGLVRID
jgi:hypothetical protein